ncbi:MAG: GAF domain-containing protein [Tannerellaceae bacterium]|jgi:GAF domain-containing protein|nr:GAF domain-containing protein [Tannerellaceae bacterium]
MAEELIIPAGGKRETYAALIPQIKSLTAGETDRTANMANIAAALKQTFGFFWVGFYVVKADTLTLGPFQGPVACTRIARGKGVCGAAWQEGRTLIVPDVDLFPGHIACNSASRSEIVVPFAGPDGIAGVLDVDSDRLAAFDETDAWGLGEIVRLIGDED